MRHAKPVLAIFYKSKEQHDNHGHHHYRAGGLASNALHSTGVLRRAGVDVHLDGVVDVRDLFQKVAEVAGHLTHCVIEALWIPIEDLKRLAKIHPNIQFLVRSHSKMGFLQVEPEAINQMKAILGLRLPNLHFCSNNKEFADSVEEVYGPCIYLPNLYDVHECVIPTKFFHDNTLHIGSFGANRLLKLHPTAALAALQTASRMGKRLKFYTNLDKTPGGESVRKTVRNLFHGLSWAEHVEVTWQESDLFKLTIAAMDLVIQLSATETFNMVAADAVNANVPVVVSPSITWVPKWERVPIDDTSKVAEICEHVLHNAHQIVHRQKQALNQFIEDAKEVWLNYLKGYKH